MSAVLTLSATEQDLAGLLDTYAGLSPDNPDRPALQLRIVDAVTMTLADCESETRIAADEIRRLQARKALFERSAGEIEAAVRDAMEFAGEKELRGAAFTLKLQRKPSSVLIVDAEAIPAAYRTLVPASWTPNKVEIGKALKRGEAVSGADLSEGNMRLVWR